MMGPILGRKDEIAFQILNIDNLLTLLMVFFYRKNAMMIVCML